MAYVYHTARVSRLTVTQQLFTHVRIGPPWLCPCCRFAVKTIRKKRVGDMIEPHLARRVQHEVAGTGGGQWQGPGS